MDCPMGFDRGETDISTDNTLSTKLQSLPSDTPDSYLVHLILMYIGPLL